jgi:hypothetical protein
MRVRIGILMALLGHRLTPTSAECIVSAERSHLRRTWVA